MLVGCGSSEGEVEKVDKLQNPPTATITIKDYGTMEAELYPDKAPNTVNNFIELANKNFYDGLTIHRVQKDFVIQGGDPNGDGTGGPGYGIQGEFAKNKFADNDISHVQGVLSMARSQSPNSGGSQFFIMTKDATQLDGSYAAFGKVTKGLDVLEKLNNVEVKGKTEAEKADIRGQEPVEKIEIQSIKINLNDYKAKEAIKVKE
ncbi:MAG: peptidylprolyl isomerase [Sarcina sp.]